MANYILREMPDIRNAGRKTVYPQLETYTRINLDELAQHICQNGSVYDAGTIKGVITRVEEAIVNWLSNGHTVKLDGLGTFSLSLQFADGKDIDMKDDDDRMAYRRVEVRTLNFRPDDEMVQNLRRATELERRVGSVKSFRRGRFTPQERINRALSVIGEQGYITLSQYARLNGMSDPVASRELKAIVQDPDCPIAVRGRAPHRVWVKKQAGE